MTIDVEGRFVTTWDALTLTQVSIFRPQGTAPIIGAALSADDQTLATVAADRTVTLWSVGENKAFATFAPPSPLVARCFPSDVHWGMQPAVRIDGPFWQTVAALLPPPPAKKK